MVGRLRRWWILSLGVNAHTLSTVALFGLPVILPVLRQDLGVSLATAGLITSAPSVGAMATLILWGALADRRGERVVIGTGVTACAVLLACAAVVTEPLLLVVLLGLGGAAGAAAVVGGGRIVLRWFPPHERGIAMGLRQVSYTLGMAIAAFALPPIAHVWGLTGTFVASAVACLVSAVLAALFIADPPATAPPRGERPGPSSGRREASPYRGPELWRVHGSSALLVIPQFAVSTYGVSCLVDAHHWDRIGAGQVFGAAALAGAAARLAAGYWSDRTGRRMAPWRLLTLAGAGVMAVLAASERMSWWPAVVALLVASVVTVSGNGLAYLGAGELAGPRWAGRVLGAHNAVQNVVAFVLVPVLGAVIGAFGYWSGFAIGAVVALAAVPLIPVAAERVRRAAGRPGEGRPPSASDGRGEAGALRDADG
ncbi:MFS family permease [Thermocatellispora tengchongensis]|uniref:MFS family permease n=1 Tax=Thermocatellispora tengchongensis TaxID=1073253 RepID=A0A840PBH1_9ACTN|nr:MFS transporter [Thermocatellispora tengchongensis]MBB5136349.1 MFS family permease [Thermocatellispora tengchongensis]